jgi:hypothetical protein
MRDACDGKAPAVTRTRREYDPELEEVLFIAEELPAISDDWSVLIGDALYNLRCALEHLWWQLAIDHLGRKPTAQEAPRIQFPIIDNPDDWSGHRFLKHVDGEAADKAKLLQGYGGGDDQIAYLSILGFLSNFDKHREVHLAFFVGSNRGAPNPSPDQCTDCKIPSRMENGEEVWEMTLDFGDKGFPGSGLEVGDVVMGMKVIPTGPNPDIDLEPQVTGQITLRNGEPILPLLDHFGRLVTWIIDDFTPLLRPELPAQYVAEEQR